MSERAGMKMAQGRVSPLVLLLLVLLLLTHGCVALRPGDEQRTQMAEQAAAAAQELRQPEVSPFESMKENVTAVEGAWDQLTEIQTQDREDTFYADLGNMSRQDLRDEMMVAVQVHLLTLSTARTLAATAAKSVQEQLARQDKIQRLLGEVQGDDLAAALENLEKRLDWIHDLQVKISRALAINAQHETASGSGDGAAASGANAAGASGQPAPAKAIPEQSTALLTDLRTFLSEVNTNPQVQASGELLLRAGQQVTDIERQRLVDLHQHLTDIKRGLNALEDRQGDYFRWLALPAFAVVLNRDDFWLALENLEDALQASCPEDSEPGQETNLPLLSDQALEPPRPRSTPAQDVACLIQDIRADKEGQDDAIARTQTLWDKRVLRDFVEESLKQTESADPAFGSPAVLAARLIPQLAVLLFVEEPANQQVELRLARLQHLHSIRQSQINADERLALVEQVAQALQIYYQGGISPAELAQAIMLGSQVLATYFIGSQL